MSQRLDWSEYGAVNSVKLLAGGGGEIHLLTGHDDGQLVVSSVNTEAVNTLKVISHHDNILWSIDISRQHVTTCSEDRTVAVYDRAELVSSLPPSPRPSCRLLGHTQAVTCVSLAEHIITTGSRDKTVIVWSLATHSDQYQVLAVLEVVVESQSVTSHLSSSQGHQEILHFVSQDEHRIYSSDHNGELFVWDKRRLLEGGQSHQGQLLLRRVDYGEERGAIDCMVVRGQCASQCLHYGPVLFRNTTTHVIRRLGIRFYQ